MKDLAIFLLKITRSLISLITVHPVPGTGYYFMN